MAAGWCWPNGTTQIPTVTDEYGRRAVNPATGVIGAMHWGIDLVGFATVRAAADGVVIFASYYGGAGNYVKVQHPGGTVTGYKHLARIDVSVGQQVQRGQALGPMGTTGDSTGVHCHFETQMTNAHDPMNPRDFMNARFIEGASLGTLPFPTESEIEMFIVNNNGTQFLFVPGRYVKHITGFNPELPTIQAAYPGIVTIGFGPGENPAKSEEMFVYSMIAFGFTEFTRDQVFNLSLANNGKGGGILYVTQPGKGGVIDMTQVTATIKSAVNAVLADLEVDVDEDKIATLTATKVDAALADNFAKIPKPPTEFVAKA